MELDDAVLAHAYGEVGDSAACAFWEGFLRCVRVLSCEHESRSNVCSDMSWAIHYPSKPPTHPGRARGAYASDGRPRAFLPRTALPLYAEPFYFREIAIHMLTLAHTR